MSEAISLALLDGLDTNLERVVLSGLRVFNDNLFPDHKGVRDLAIAIQSDGKEEPVGGFIARTAGGWLAIELIFVPETLRGQGWAKRLLALAEEEARRRGCHSAWLDTINPEAAKLYQRLGYEIFGELKNYPAGNSRFFLQKSL